MSKFKLGNKVRETEDEGREGIVIMVDFEAMPKNVPYKVKFEDDDWAWFKEEQIELVKDKRGRPKKPAKEHAWTILKDDCKNHEDTFTSTEEKALQKLKDCGVGYSLYKLSRAHAHYELNLKIRNKHKPKKKVKK